VTITPELLASLYREHAPALRLYARQWGTSGDDFVQEAFLALARQPSLPEPLAPWLYRVVRNEALQANRQDNRRRRREAERDAAEAWFSHADDQLDAAEAMRLLTELPLELREVIVARIWGGLTFEEIAGLVGCSLATAQRRYQVGLAQLHERLEGRCTPTRKT
jgi:RNA polymerase sigma-70 factor (ECF subfamily)